MFQGKIENKCDYHIVNVNNGKIKSAFEGRWHENKTMILGTAIVDLKSENRRIVPVVWPIDKEPILLTKMQTKYPKMLVWKPDGKYLLYFDGK